MAVATDILTTKLHRAFHLLDGDGDGVIVPADFSVLASKLAAAFSAEEDIQKITKLEQTLIRFWETDFARMDADGNGELDKDEYTAGWRSALADPQSGIVERFLAIVEAWMDVADTNGNGLIDLDEYQRMFHLTMGASKADLEAAFRKLDLDGSGELDSSEIRQAAIEYFTSDNPEAPGNWLFGPI